MKIKSGEVGGVRWACAERPGMWDGDAVTVTTDNGSVRYQFVVMTSVAPALITALTAAMEKPKPVDDTGPRWGKPPVECTWLGRGLGRGLGRRRGLERESITEKG